MTLDLPVAYRTEVWRLLKEALQSDPVYDRAGIALSFYDGDHEILSDLDTAMGPILQFYPFAGPAGQFDEASTAGMLQVKIEGRLPRLDIEDVFNLQEVLESTLNTIGDAAEGQRYVEAGATTGVILFQQPLRDTGNGKPGADNILRLAGMFQIEVRRPLLVQ